MRAPADLPRSRFHLTRGRVWLIVALIVVLILLFSLRGIADFYTDYLWFGSVHLSQVWRGMLGAKIGLALFFIAVFFAGMWASLAVADRLAPKDRPLGAEEELVKRYRKAVTPRAVLVRTIVSLVLAVLVGVGASGQWKNWILFRNSVPFGIKDPQFHTDASFYVFRLPFYSFLVSWVFLALAIILIVTAMSMYLNGGIRLQGQGQRVTPQVKAHLSVILSLMALDKAIGYYLQRFDLVTSTRGYVEGATYTDVHAQLPALTLLIFISLAAFVILIVNIRRQGWVLPVIGVGLWLFIALVVGVIYPAFIQTFKVEPSQNTLERPYISRNIAATRYAMGINNVKTSSFQDSSSLSAAQVAAPVNQETLSSVRLWDPGFAQDTFDKLQNLRSYYNLSNLASDRYTINGQTTPAIVAVREVNPTQLPAQSWVNSHLQYTHGYGAVLAPANQADQDGNPTFAIQNIPPVSSDDLPQLSQPAVYFGQNMSGYVIADTKQPEIDYQLPNGNNKETSYRGSGGVPAGSVFRRAAFALRFGDINPLISGLVTSNSRVIFVRDIQQMVQMAAPFLQFDADPYATVIDGKIYWVVDAYTTTDHFPYGQTADTSAVNPSSGLATTSFNYVRNSVKVVIDAYNGNMTFYDMDPHDPVIEAYSKAFPGMFTPSSQMSPQLRAHLRYPEDIFTVQSAMYGRYHITNPVSFYNAGDAWELSQNPGAGSPSAALSVTAATNAQGQVVGPVKTTRMSPIYQVMAIPGQDKLSFNILEAYVPVSQNDVQQNLTAFMIGDSDPAHYGQLYSFVTPRGQQFDGPALIDARISATQSISQQISLLNQQGSQVVLGNVLMVPVDQSLVYIRPMYVSSSRNSLPELKNVIVVFGQQATMSSTLSGALGQAFSAPVPTTTPSGGGGGGGVSAEVSSLLNQAQQVYSSAQAALKSGNLGAYQSDINQLGGILSEAAQLSGQPAGGSGSSNGSGSGSTNGSSSGSTNGSSLGSSGGTGPTGGGGATASSGSSGTTAPAPPSQPQTAPSSASSPNSA
jgi:uncharacterized membrane protein (UPF0182 family)